MGQLARLFDFLFPRFCVSCKTEGSVLCPTCENTLTLSPPVIRCPFCGEGESNHTCTSCRSVVFLDGLFVLSEYKNPVVRELIHLWKYVGDAQAQEQVVKLLRRADVRLPVFTVAPIPLALSRLRERGFDQADVIARELATTSGLSYQPCVRRFRATSPRAQVVRAKRLVGDLDHAFDVVAPVPEQILLCDDVFTSGATMDAAAKVLKRAGAKEVWGFAIAKG